MGRIKGRGLLLKPAILSFFALITIAIGGVSMAQGPEHRAQPAKKDLPISKSQCLECHADEEEGFKAVNIKGLADSPHKDTECQDCHPSIVALPHTPSMEHQKAACVDCHEDEVSAFTASAHSKPDKVAGDHPTCVTCHGNGDPHAIKPVATFTRTYKVALCSSCHRDTARMMRYGVDPDAVVSYEDSFHGKALLRFHTTNVAICTDCHTTHSMLPPSDPRAPTNRANAAHLCSQKSCHNGATANFAMSGANHLRLKIKQDPYLRGTNLFFQILVVGMIAFLILGVLLDMRLKVFGKGTPRCGRPAGLLVSISFLLATTSLGAGLFRQTMLVSSLLIGALIFLLLAYAAYFLGGSRQPASPLPARMHERFTASQRIQHWLLFLCFTVLVATGLPLHFYTVSWLQSLYAMLGGLHVARVIHRVAAVGLIVVFLYHVVDLLIRWARAGFTFRVWTMLPTLQDGRDFISQTKVYFGLSKVEPQHGRFQVRQKLDYLAEYWGIPVMVLSGIIMWFPIYWGNHLPEEAISIAIVAHGWEATLAFLAIVLWHLNQEIFSPDAFPLRTVMITGKISEEDMAIEHPLELKRLQDLGPEGL